MKKKIRHVLLLGLAALLTANFTFAQTKAMLVGVTYRTSDLQICNGDLGDYYKLHVNQSLTTDIFFENLQIVKIRDKKSFYLLAKEQNSSRAYAFALVRRGNGLYLDPQEHVQVTSKGEAVLVSYLKNENNDQSCTDCVETVVASAKL
ncbi:hypothetical protein [Botryobacter ruber]|uniref:hypothetical protein n=1 Tax=Botryobacter ruber TaxID=2171629 RepID=UPI000E0AC6B3|nr:hypothetical protein [Botryobacter ruber]